MPDYDFVHTGPGTLASRYMRMFWQPVYRSDDLKAGHAVPLRIMNEDFTLYRGRSGTPFVVGPRCAHRRTALSVGRVEEDCIRCLYHGWKYDEGGKCIDQPAEPVGFTKNVRIASYPAREYLGLIFAYFGGGRQPELPRFPEFEAEGVLEVETFVRACNYFNGLDKACDPLHVFFTHQDPRMKVDVRSIAADESEFGVTTGTSRTKRSRVRVSLLGMPNVALFRLPPAGKNETSWREFASWSVPLDDEHYVSFNLTLIHLTGKKADRFRQRRARKVARARTSTTEMAARILAGKAAIDDFKTKTPNIVRLQDDVVLAAQGAIPDRENEYLGRSDTGVVLLRRIWQRELAALAEGGQLKKWTRPANLLATTGIAER
ncbi:MAG TPA: Rieske 2Fe-2S domain-containing protein [Xanthobacteraceae bacterium]|jgi:5,5'-dehydrodivanillate O-demethylase|nr:Rieske 2Fe-2S domain-containing protein [Xanthobacteraceae bacterium]